MKLFEGLYEEGWCSQRSGVDSSLLLAMLAGEIQRDLSFQPHPCLQHLRLCSLPSSSPTLAEICASQLPGKSACQSDTFWKDLSWIPSIHTYFHQKDYWENLSSFIPFIIKNNTSLENKNNICGRNYFFTVE